MSWPAKPRPGSRRVAWAGTVFLLAAWLGTVPAAVHADHAPGCTAPGPKLAALADPAGGDPQPEPPEPDGEDALRIEAAEYAQLDLKARVFQARGHVRVRHEDFEVRADVMTYDLRRAEATFTGNVLVSRAGQEMRGTAFHYRVADGVGELTEARGVLYAEPVNDPMYVSGSRIRMQTGQIVITGGRLTTCGEGDPPYHMAAREMVIYPGERLVVRGVTFWEHGIPLFYWPFLTLSLREGETLLELPSIGYSDADGWYVKTLYHYAGGESGYGVLYLDYFQRRGPGGGVRHVYRDALDGKGSVYAYAVGNADGGMDGVLEWDRRYRLRSDLEVGATAAYRASTRPAGEDQREWSAQLSVEERGESRTTVVAASHRRLFGIENGVESSVTGDLERQLAGAWRLRLTGDWSDQRLSTVDRRWLGYLAELENRADRYTLTVAAEQLLHPDLKKATGSLPWRTMSRLPEVTLTSRVQPLGPQVGNLELRAAAGHLREEPVGLSAWRGDLGLRMPERTVARGAIATWTLGGGARATGYSTRDYQLAWQHRAGVTVRPSGGLSLNLQYGYQEVWGRAPFQFDRLTPSETLTARLQWHGRPAALTVSTGFDFRTWTWHTVRGTLALQPHRDLKVEAHGTYNVYTQSLGSVVGLAHWTPRPDWSLRLGVKYDVPGARLERADAELGVSLGKGWRISYTGIYDSLHNEFLRGDVSISKDLACREVSLRLDQLRREVWLEYRIYAFPSSRVRVGASEDRLMFDADVLNDLLGS